MYQKIGQKLKEKQARRTPKTSVQAEDEKLTGNGGGAELPDFAKALKALRAERDISLEKLSKLTGINKQTLHSVENYSTRNPSFANLEKIATAFKLSLNDLLLMARGEYEGNLYKTTAGQRWSIGFEIEKGFSIHSFSPLSAGQRDFFIGVMTLRAGKKLRYWKFTSQAKACIQPWEGDLLFIYHGMNWRKEMKVSANETLYYDASIPHTFENVSGRENRVLLVTYPSIF